MTAKGIDFGKKAEFSFGISASGRIRPISIHRQFFSGVF